MRMHGVAVVDIMGFMSSAWIVLSYSSLLASTSLVSQPANNELQSLPTGPLREAQ